MLPPDAIAQGQKHGHDGGAAAAQLEGAQGAEVCGGGLHAVNSDRVSGVRA